MSRESIILRLLGAFSLISGGYWFWKTDFTLVTIMGIPLPVQIILIVIGFFVLISPAPFLRIITVFLPTEQSKRFTEFINTKLDSNSEQLEIKPEDKGEVLADKLNYAIFVSKRRFYVGAVIGLIIFPLLTLYYIRIKAEEKADVLRESESFVKAVQNNRLTFSSADKYHELIEQNPSIKSLNPEKSSTGKIYKILSQIFNEKVTDEQAFDTAITGVYNAEIDNVLKFGDFDFKKINVPITETDSKDADKTLYLLLATICNIKGENGRFMEPLLYGRGILNQIDIKPSVFYHVSGWNYSGLLKSTAVHKFETYGKLANSVFFNIIPTKLSLAAKALEDYRKYKDGDNSQLAIIRYENNFVDIHLPVIWMLRVNQENYTGENKEEAEVLKIKTTNLTKLFQDLHEHLDKTKGYVSDPIIYTTKAQLYSLEGEVNYKENTENGKNVDWCKKQRNLALEMIKVAYGPKTKDSLCEDRETNYLNWLWSDPEAKEERSKICK